MSDTPSSKHSDHHGHSKNPLKTALNSIKKEFSTPTSSESPTPASGHDTSGTKSPVSTASGTSTGISNVSHSTAPSSLPASGHHTPTAKHQHHHHHEHGSKHGHHHHKDSDKATPKTEHHHAGSHGMLPPDELRRRLASVFQGHKKSKKAALASSDLPTPMSDSSSASDSDGPGAKQRAKEAARMARLDKKKELADKIERQALARYEADPLRVNYGLAPIVSPNATRQDVQRDSFEKMEDMQEGQKVIFRARIHHIRNISSKVTFVVFRQSITTMQGVIRFEDEQTSQNMVKWIGKQKLESVVLVNGVIQSPQAGQQSIKSTSIKTKEVLIKQLYVLGTVTSSLPFHVEDVEMPTYHIDKEQLEEAVMTTDTARKHAKDSRTAVTVGTNTRLDNRLIDLRSDVSQAIFRIQAGIVKYFRRHLDDHGFIEIHTSKLQGGATESGASVFKVDYFGRPVFLAQSPQLGKQMAIAADFERVYEVGPVFRAENSNTHRHLTEFTGLDLEMAIEDHYHEVVDMLDGALLAIFKGLQTDYRRELDTIRKMYPSKDLVFPEKTVRLHFHDGVQMLRDSGWTEDGHDVDYYEDFSTKTEKRLGQLVKEKYGTDYYILDKFPLSARPFYTMPDPSDPKRCNACDFFIRGEEILSGGQRIHQSQLLEQRMKECGVDPSVMAEYMDGFKQGCPPHGGGGIGLERVVFLFLGLGNIRWATLYPRDPRSFSQDIQNEQAKRMPTAADKFKGPMTDTIEYAKNKLAGKHVELPTLEDLIATYGDSPNTSWLDPFWTVWRHSETGGAVGYAVSDKHALVWGRPLCDDRQIYEVAKAFHHHMKHEKLKPIWACIDDASENVLSDQMGWKSVIAVAEQRVNPINIVARGDERDVRHKISRAEREGVVVEEKTGGLSEDEANEVRVRIRDWQKNRHGTQVYSAGLRPFDDPKHRVYYLARDRSGTVCGLCVLAQLAPKNGFQVKYSLDFPGCPPGTIELVISSALKGIGKLGVEAATFGGSAPEKIIPQGENWGFSAKLLSKSYATITKTFRLTDKATFREKFGSEADPQFISFPKHGLGLRGIEAIMKVLQAPKSVPDDLVPERDDKKH